MLAILKTLAIDFLAANKGVLYKLAGVALVSWFVTAGGCSLTAKASMAWAKRQAYRQGYREGQATCEEPKEQRRWRLFAPAVDGDAMPTFGIFYGINDPICYDGETIEFPSPTPAAREQ